MFTHHVLSMLLLREPTKNTNIIIAVIYIYTVIYHWDYEELQYDVFHSNYCTTSAIAKTIQVS